MYLGLLVRQHPAARGRNPCRTKPRGHRDRASTTILSLIISCDGSCFSYIVGGVKRPHSARSRAWLSTRSALQRLVTSTCRTTLAGLAAVGAISAVVLRVGSVQAQAT